MSYYSLLMLGGDGADIASFIASPTTIPANHATPIEIVLTGDGTTWLDDDEDFAISGVDSCVKTGQEIRSNTDASVFVRTI